MEASKESERTNSLAASVVVCAHTMRRVDQVVSCVQSIRAGSEQPRELVLVIDSNPELLAHLGGVLPEDVMLIESVGSGVSEARNTGLKLSSADVVAFIDDDATADHRWLEELLAGFAEHPLAVGLGGRILPNWESPNHRLPDELLWVVGCTYAGHPEHAQPIGRPIGCNMAFRRAALEQAGGFSKDFGPSGEPLKSNSNEEIVLALALRAEHGEDCIWYRPQALVRHFVPASRLRWSYLVERCLAEGRSKAEVRGLHGTPSMRYDRGYVVETLIPAIGRYALRGIRGRDAAAGRRAVVATAGLLLTAWGYGERSLVRTARRTGR